MYLDGQLNFSTTQALTTTAASTNIIDLAGLGSGTALSNILGNATASNWGMDIGVGDSPGKPKIMVSVVTALTGGTSLNIQFQGAPDNGSGSPGTYVTYAESGAILTASLLANAVIFKVDVPEIQPEGPTTIILPRFLRLNYVIVGSYGAGTVNANIIRDRQDYLAKYYAGGFTVA